MNPADVAPAAPRHFLLRCALAYAATIGVNGIVLPYFPVWLQGLSFSPFEIGVVLAVQMLLRVLSAPLAGMLADRMAERSLMLMASAGLSLATALMLLGTERFWPVLIVFGIQAAVFAPYPPIVEAMAVTGVRRWGFSYGAMRVWGSVGFVVATLSAGSLIGRSGASVVPLVLTAVFAVAVIAAITAPCLGRMRAMGRHRRAAADTTTLRRVDLHVLMLGASLAQASHGMYYAFSSLHWRETGFSSAQVGFLWTAGVVAEISVFFLAGRISRRFAPGMLLRIGCCAAMLRWALFPIPLGFGLYICLQFLHAFTFALVHLGLQQRLVELVREDQESAAQGAYVFYNGVTLGAATILSGMLYRQFGVSGYYAMSVLALLGLATITLAGRLQPQRDASGGWTSEPS